MMRQKRHAAGGTADVHATQRAARRSDLAETSSGRAVKSPTEPSESSAKHEAPPDVTHALPNGPTQEIGARWGPDIDVEALLANVEASLANDAEVAQVVKPANLHARPVAEVIKRFSRDWKLMASACAFISVAMVGVVTLSHGMLAVPNTPPRADEPSIRETMTRDDSAERALKDRAPEPSSAAEDRLGANSEGVGATASAAQANETPESGADPSNHRTNEWSTVRIGARGLRPDGAPGAARTTFRLQARPRRPDRDRHLLAGAAGAIFRP